jgi:putative aldouronate transport system permease protein
MGIVGRNMDNCSKKKIQKQALRRIINDKYLHLLVLPTVIFFLIFTYYPMYGIIIAFKDYSFSKGILGSPWADNYGFEHFLTFFHSMYFGRLLKNTIVLSLETLIWSFPFPIVFSLLLHEVRFRFFRRAVQSISYFPYFVSVVVIVGIMNMVLHQNTGIVNELIRKAGGQPVMFMQSARWFRPLFVISTIWQGFGWSSIIYLAALSGVSMELFEAAEIDGANRFQRVIHVSIPSIAPTIVIMFILAIGGLLNVSADKILLMYSPGIYDVADVINTYVYRAGLTNMQYSFSASVGFFNSFVNFVLLYFANRLSHRLTEISLW